MKLLTEEASVSAPQPKRAATLSPDSFIFALNTAGEKYSGSL